MRLLPCCMQHQWKTPTPSCCSLSPPPRKQKTDDGQRTLDVPRSKDLTSVLCGLQGRLMPSDVFLTALGSCSLPPFSSQEQGVKGTLAADDTVWGQGASGLPQRRRRRF